MADRLIRMSEIHSQQAGVSAVVNQSDSGKDIQRLSADRSPSRKDAVVVAGGEKNEEGQKQVQTWRFQGRNSGRQVISKGLLNSSQGGTPL